MSSGARKQMNSVAKTATNDTSNVARITGTISINHSQVMTQVNRLRGLAGELEALRTRAQNSLRNRETYWQGAAANRFEAENERWRNELRLIERDVVELAALIQRVADEIREAERQARAAIESSGGQHG
jgi:WXG100 family type VII secretion target